MTSRERILSTINYQQPDFIPVDLGATSSTFWGGGVETVGTLNTGTPQQITEQVLKRLEIFSKGSGYVFNTVHNILPDVPPENMIALFEAVNEFTNSYHNIFKHEKNCCNTLHAEHPQRNLSANYLFKRGSVGMVEGRPVWNVHSLGTSFTERN